MGARAALARLAALGRHRPRPPRGWVREYSGSCARRSARGARLRSSRTLNWLRGRRRRDGCSGRVVHIGGEDQSHELAEVGGLEAEHPRRRPWLVEIIEAV